MIAIKIIPDRQRLVILRGGRFHRLAGPGIVFLFSPPGTRYRSVEIGDSGQLVTLSQARFGDATVPVELRGTASAGAVRILGFGDNVVVVAAEDAETESSADKPDQEKCTPRPQYKPHHFLIGLPVVLLFTGACLGGFLYSVNQILLERKVHERGIVTIGKVTQKVMQHNTQNNSTSYHVSYTFRTPAEFTVHSESDIDTVSWHRLKEDGPIAVRYVPESPELNLPDGRHFAGFYYWTGGFTLLGTLFFSAILIGMIVKKLAGGYRGETDPFLARDLHNKLQSRR